MKNDPLQRLCGDREVLIDRRIPDIDGVPTYSNLLSQKPEHLFECYSSGGSSFYESRIPHGYYGPCTQHLASLSAPVHVTDTMSRL